MVIANPLSTISNWFIKKKMCWDIKIKLLFVNYCSERALLNPAFSTCSVSP